MYLPNISSLANASKTLEDPIRLLNDADNVAQNKPMDTRGGHTLIFCINRLLFLSRVL